MSQITRRSFIGAAGAMAAGQALVRSSNAYSANDSIGIGCIGVGSRGTALLGAMLKVKGLEVRAICDINPDHLERAQNTVVEAGQPKPQGVDQWDKLLAMKEVDAVVSALPCDLHAACYLAVLAAGKDLYGEKPMCLSLKDCDAVIDAAQKSGRIVQLGFQRRSDPRFVETMKQVHDGEIGKLLEGRVLWSNSWGPLYDWFGHRERSGDWMVEQAVHNWDVMNWANQCRPVRAMGLGRFDLFRENQADRDVHDYYSAVVEYENGVIVDIIHSWVAPNKFNEEYSRLIGTRGGIDFNSGVFSYRPEVKKEDRVGFTTTDSNIDSTFLALQNFANSVRKREPAVATVEHGRNAVLACLLVRQAVYSKKAAEVKDILG